MASSASYYLRVDIDDTSDESPEGEPTPVGGSEAGPELTFVDLHTRLRTPHTGGVSQVEVSGRAFARPFPCRLAAAADAYVRAHGRIRSTMRCRR